MAERLRTEELPAPWEYAVTSDGRVFFINDETRITTWVHPVSGEAVASGYDDRADLPMGWQEDATAEGRVYFVNHYDESTTFSNPVTGRTEMDPDAPDAPTMNTPNANQHPPDPNAPYPEAPQSPTTLGKPSFKKRTIPKHEAPKVKRREGAVVSKDGWLLKKDSTGLGVWRKRWCVVSDFCLFYYKGADEINQAGTIMLPSYVIKPVDPRDKVNKKFAFKCEHSNMRTYHFAADTEDMMHQWIDALGDASQVNLDRGYGDQDEMDWGGGGKMQSPRSLRRNEQPPPNDEGGFPNGSADPRQQAPTRATSPPRRPGWGNYESIEFGMSPDGDTSLKNGLGSERSHPQQSSRESWEGSQPRSNHDNGSFTSSQEDRRSGQHGRLSPPRSPSVHSSSSRDRSQIDEKPKDPNMNYNYVDISEIKERKRQNQLDSQSSYPDDPRGYGQPRQMSRHSSHDDRASHSSSGHSGQRNGRGDEMDGSIQEPSMEINVSMASDDQNWGQGSPDPRSNGRPRQARRSESRRSNASQRSEPSHQRGLAPMEEVPVTRASTERLHAAPRPSESSYRQGSPNRGREPSMHDRVPPEHGRMPPQHGRGPPGHGRMPAQHGRPPSEHGRAPSDYGRVPPEHGRPPPQQGRGPPHQQPPYGRVPLQHARAPHEPGMVPPQHARSPQQQQHGQMPPPQRGRGAPQRGRGPPNQGRPPQQQRMHGDYVSRLS